MVKVEREPKVAEAASLRRPQAPHLARRLVGGGMVTGYLSLIVLLPLAAIAGTRRGSSRLL